MKIKITTPEIPEVISLPTDVREAWANGYSACALKLSRALEKAIGYMDVTAKAQFINQYKEFFEQIEKQKRVNNIIKFPRKKYIKCGHLFSYMHYSFEKNSWLCTLCGTVTP